MWYEKKIEDIAEMTLIIIIISLRFSTKFIKRGIIEC